MHTLKQKASSERGASITFALLLFLVCAIISSIVIVAATAAAGRMSERAATDQRYYAVSSAVGLLRDDFNGKTVTVEYVTTGNTDAQWNALEITDMADFLNPSNTVNETTYPLVADISKQLIGKIDADFISGTPADPTLTLTASQSDPSINLDCDIKVYILAEKKQVVFQISNTTNGTSGNAKANIMNVTFNANIRQTTSQAQKVAANETNTTVTTHTTNIEWTLAGIRKGAYS